MKTAMFRPLVAKVKPSGGLSYLLHLGLLMLLPLVLFALVQLGDTFIKLAFSIILLSKWRMFAVRLRFWPANIRANAVDIIVGLSIVLFMTHSGSEWLQLAWAVAYGIWLVFIKPGTSSLIISLQAGIGQLCGLSAIYLSWAASPLYVLVFGTGLVCYLAARHFFDSFDEQYAKLLAYGWGYFGTALAWVLGHWLLFYGVIAQPTLILSVLGYGLAALYYFGHEEKLNDMLKKQFVFVIIAVLLIILTLSSWDNKVV